MQLVCRFSHPFASRTKGPATDHTQFFEHRQVMLLQFLIRGRRRLEDTFQLLVPCSFGDQQLDSLIEILGHWGRRGHANLLAHRPGQYQSRTSTLLNFSQKTLIIR